MEYDENELAHMLAADLSHSFYYLVQRYQHLLYAFALRLSGRSQDVEDIVQENSAWRV